MAINKFLIIRKLTLFTGINHQPQSQVCYCMERSQPFCDIYPSLSKLGVTSELLLAVGDDSDHGEDIKALNVKVVTNENVIELHKFMDRHPACTYYTLWRWIASLLGDKWPQSDFPTIKAVRQSVIRLNSKLSKLKKIPRSQEKDCSLSMFLNGPYCLPKVFVSHHGKIITPSSSSSSSCSSSTENEVLRSVNEKLCEKLSALKCERDVLKESTKESRQKMYALHRNGTKKLKRRDNVIQQQLKQVNDAKKMIKDLERKVTRTEVQVHSLKVKIDRIRHRASYWKLKCSQLEQVNGEELAEVIATEESKQTHLREEIRTLEYENVELRDAVEEIMAEANERIKTFEKGKYTDNVRACCYELLSLNVGVRNVKAVIESVLANIAHRQVDRLPKKTVLADMMMECLTIAQAQLGEELSSEGGGCYTLQTDGTTKHGQHFGTYDIATVDMTYNLGIRHVFSGSAQNTLETLIEILDDLDVVRKEIGECDVSSKIVSKLKNTMTDRHAAEKLFANILADYRADILPDIVAGWEQMAEEEREQLTRMNNFFCGLHFLVGLADAAEEVLKVWEDTIDSVEGQRKTSGTQNLIRTACKAFHHRGSEQSGCSTHFRTYLRHKGITKIPLAAFVGNRFNILFYDAAGVFFLKSHMIEYLTNSHGSSLNRLLQSVLKDLKSPYFIAGCKALGIIDKLVTGPFWRHLQSSTISILGMSGVYTNMREKFERWSSDAQKVLENEEMLFEDCTSTADEVASYLFEPADDDHLVQELLQLLCKAFTLTMDRLLIDHLPGGVFHEVSDPTIITETMSVPKTNVSPERDFALLDRLMAQKPNASHIALESLILFSQNKTSDWLENKTAEERERLIKAARTLTKHHRTNFKKRREEIETKRRELQEERERELAKKRAKELKEKESLTLMIQQFGLWTTSEEVLQCVDQLRTKKAKVDALKVQINFRKKVLNQCHEDKLVFQFSHNRQALSVDQLTQNLIKLLPGGDQPCEFSVDQICRDPELLLYQRIEHLFDCDGIETWCKGTVLSFDSEKKEFQVAYDNEDVVYSFPLLEDLKNGELKVMY